MKFIQEGHGGSRGWAPRGYHHVPSNLFPKMSPACHAGVGMKAFPDPLGSSDAQMWVCKPSRCIAMKTGSHRGCISQTCKFINIYTLVWALPEHPEEGRGMRRGGNFFHPSQKCKRDGFVMTAPWVSRSIPPCTYRAVGFEDGHPTCNAHFQTYKKKKTADLYPHASWAYPGLELFGARWRADELNGVIRERESRGLW